MSNWNLPPGCSDADVDRAFGGSQGRRGVYTVTIVRTSETTIEIEAGSEEDARFDAVIAAKALPADKWEDEFDTTEVEGPPERDPVDEERGRSRDFEMDKLR